MSVRETFMFFGDVFQTIYLLDSLFIVILIQYCGKDLDLLFYLNSFAAFARDYSPNLLGSPDSSHRLLFRTMFVSVIGLHDQ